VGQVDNLEARCALEALDLERKSVTFAHRPADLRLSTKGSHAHLCRGGTIGGAPNRARGTALRPTGIRRPPSPTRAARSRDPLSGEKQSRSGHRWWPRHRACNCRTASGAWRASDGCLQDRDRAGEPQRRMPDRAIVESVANVPRLRTNCRRDAAAGGADQNSAEQRKDGLGSKSLRFAGKTPPPGVNRSPSISLCPPSSPACRAGNDPAPFPPQHYGRLGGEYGVGSRVRHAGVRSRKGMACSI
jgi:hypothetical protein